MAIANLLDIVTTAGMLYVVALGLLVVFGVLKIINLAHGAFLTIGAYAAIIATQLQWSPWVSLILAPVIGVILAAVIERLVLQPIYERPLDTILATWGLNIIILQLITLYFGREVQFAKSPMSHAISIAGSTYSQYRLFLFIMAVVLGVAVALILGRTRIGLVARAVVLNEELAQGLGINTRRVRFVTFCLGAGLASLAGALITPLFSVNPYLGVPWLVNSFMLVLVAGVSLSNLAVATLVLGGAQVLVSSYGSPVLGSLTIVLLAVIILRFRSITI